MPLKTAKSRTAASQRWLSRQLNDPYVAAARQQGWRSRAAFKLIELDDRFHLIRPGARVLDLGAAPGGWTQVAVKRGASSVLAVDLLPIDPIHGATDIQGDFADPDMPDAPDGRTRRACGPGAVGHGAEHHGSCRDRPHPDRGAGRDGAGFRGADPAPGGGFVAKVFQGGSERTVLDILKRHFSVVRHAKPPASRKQSSELYVVALGFKGSSDPLSGEPGGARDLTKISPAGGSGASFLEIR